MKNGNLVTKIIAAIVIALGVWVWNTNSRLAVIEHNASHDAEQDEAIDKFWKINGWSRDQINGLRTVHGQPIVSWPDL